jgi:MFS family permease
VTFRRSTIWILGLGAFGLAFSLTITATCLPFILSKFTDSTSLIGVILGAEGIFALVVSPVIGPWSDSFHTPLGRRKPFMIAALAPLGFCLLMMPFMPNIWTATLIVLAFFVAYYVYEPPYRGLYPDLVPRAYIGRSQGVQHQLRGVALLLGSVGGTLLLKVWDASPFIVASFVTTAACGAAAFLSHEEGGHSRVFAGIRSYISHSWQIFRHEPELRRFLTANAAWEGAFAAARTFVFLYVTVGLHQSKAISSAVLGAVGAGYVIAALLAGRIGDRFGLARVIVASSFVYGGGFLVAGLAQSWHDWYLVFIVLVSIAGGTVMTLAWGLLFKLTPAQHRGAFSGLATTTKGIGLLVGAPLAGLAIDLSKSHLQATDGYQVLWPICGIPILLAIPLVASLIPHESASGSAEPQPS